MGKLLKGGIYRWGGQVPPNRRAVRGVQGPLRLGGLLEGTGAIASQKRRTGGGSARAMICELLYGRRIYFIY